MENQVTTETVKQLISDLTPGNCLLVRALKTNTDSKIQLEFAEKTQGLEGNANALLAMLNASDDRFTSGARRAWMTAEITDASKSFNLNFGDDAEWIMDPNLNKEILPLGIMNPSLAGFDLRVRIEETTEGTDWQLENVDRSAKRKGKDGDFITSEGKYIFSNTRVVPMKAGVNPTHVTLDADVTSQTEEVSNSTVQDEVGM